MAENAFEIEDTWRKSFGSSTLPDKISSQYSISF